MDNIRKLDELGELGKKIRRWERHKLQKEAFLTYLIGYFNEANSPFSANEARLKSLIPRLRECGSYLLIRHYYLQDLNRLIGANFCCQHKLCGLCAIRRAAKGAMNLHDKAKKVLVDEPHLKPYYVVLTVKNEPDLSDGMQKLKLGWTRIRKKIADAKRAQKTQHPEQSKYASALKSQFAGVLAGAYSVEVTYNEVEGTWHPHMNLLLLSGREMANMELSEEWEIYTGDSFITHCQEVNIEEDKWAFCEIMKYAMKFSELPFKQHIQAYLDLHGQRLKGTVGKFYNVDLDPDPADDELEGEPYIEILLSFYNGHYWRTRPYQAGVEKSHKRSKLAKSQLNFRSHVLAP